MALLAPTRAHQPVEAAAQAGRKAGAWLLGGIVLLALLLRFWGLGWQLPHVLYFDELKYAGPAARSALKIEGERADFRNPSLFRHLLDLELRLLNPFLPRPADRLAADYSLQASAFLVARLTSALLGTASVVLLYAVGRGLFGPLAGLLAAALLAVNFLHVHLSHFGLNDVPATFFLIAALVPSLALLDRPTRHCYLLAGLLAGLATAAKYNFGVVLAVPAAVWLVQAARRASPPGSLLLGPLLLGLGALGGFLIGMPEVLRSFQEVQQDFRDQAALGAQRWDGQESDPIPLLYARTLLRAFGLPGALAALAGSVLLLSRRTTLGLVLLAAPLLYLAVMLSTKLFFARFALPLVPFGCLFAAYGLTCLWSSIRTPRLKTALLVAASLMVVGWPLLLSIRANLLASQTDTRVEAWRWVVSNLPPGSRLATQIYSLPISRPGDQLRQGRLADTFGSLTNRESFRRITCDGFQYVLTASFQQDRERTRGARGQPTGYQQLWEHGEHVVRFAPGLSQSSVAFHVDDTGLPFWRLEQYAQPGPTVDVYRLPPGLCQR